MKLQTYSPLGLNSKPSDFGCIYHFSFGCITNNEWKIYSIKAAFKAAAITTVASIHFHSLLTFTN